MIDDSITQGGDKEDCSAGDDDPNLYKNDVRETKLMESQGEHDLHEDLELHRSFNMPWMFYFLNMKNVEMPSQSNVKSDVAYVEVGESRIFKSILVSQLNGNPTLSKNRLSWIKVGMFINPKLLTVANHGTMLMLGSDCGLCFLNTPKARIVK